MTISTVTQLDVDYTSLEDEDIGKYCIVVQGCYHLFDTELEAQQAIDTINEV